MSLPIRDHRPETDRPAAFRSMAFKREKAFSMELKSGIGDYIGCCYEYGVKKQEWGNSSVTEYI